MTQAEAAERLYFSTAKMIRIELGQVIDIHGFRAMLDLYGVVVPDWADYEDLHECALERGWWHNYGHDDRGFISIEADACLVRTFQSGYIPGLLQTRAYMTQVFTSARRPLEGVDLENAVTVRMRRQRRLFEEPILQLHAIIDESVLRRPVGLPNEHREQLQHLIEQAELPNVTIQIVPLSIGAYPGQSGNLTIASFPDKGDADVSYVEHLLGSVHIERGPQADAASLIFNDIADRALDPQDSISLIERVIAEL